MTLDEQIIACARANGYDGDDRTSDGSLRLPHRKNNEWQIYYTTGDKNNPDGIWVWSVTDEELKQWQRDYKLNQLGVNEKI